MHASDRDEGEKPPSRIPRSASAAFGALAGVRLGPAGVVAGAAAGPYLEELARRAWDEFRPDSQRRQAEMLASAAEAAGSDPEELADLIGGSEHTRLLNATAMAAAARTAWPPQVAAIGRALADGLIAKDTAQPNIADLVLPAMAEMERLHVSLLELLVRWVPDRAVGQSLRLQAYQSPATHTASDEWRAGKRIWTARLIGEVRPPLLPVLTSLIGTLQRHGLAVQHDDIPSVLAKYARQFDSAMRGSPAMLLEPFLRNITQPPAWSPTELGEQALGYYHLAAAEFDAAQALPPGDG